MTKDADTCGLGGASENLASHVVSFGEAADIKAIGNGMNNVQAYGSDMDCQKANRRSATFSRKTIAFGDNVDMKTLVRRGRVLFEGFKMVALASSATVMRASGASIDTKVDVVAQETGPTITWRKNN